MTQGGLFKLILKDDRFDQFFRLTESLRNTTYGSLKRSHLLYISHDYKPFVAFASEYIKVKPTGDSTGAITRETNVLRFIFPVFSHYTSDIVLHLKIQSVGSYALFSASSPLDPTTANPLYQFCPYTGLRVCKKVSFYSDSVLVDEYNIDDAIMYHKFFVKESHQDGWKACHGQQIPKKATMMGNGCTQTLEISDGHQTPKLYHEELEMFIPLQFWFCKDLSSAIPNHFIPTSQRTILIEMNTIENIIQTFINPQDDNGVNDDILTPVSLPISKLNIEAELYVNGIYLDNSIYDLVTSHTKQKNILLQKEDSIILHNMRFPTEYMMIGFRNRQNTIDFNRWFLMGTPKVHPTNNYKSFWVFPTCVNITGSANFSLRLRLATEFTTLENFVDTLNLSSYGLDISPVLPTQFYNCYIPLRYADQSLTVSPHDNSVFLLTFAHYIGKKDFNGYFNLSTNRELYITYKFKSSHQFVQSYQANQAEMIISMTAINILYRNGDRLALKFSV